MSRYSVNLLALNKDPAIMRCFKAPEGCVLGQFDLSAVEPRVLTYMSQDPILKLIYGKDAWPHHDIYFIAGMKIPVIGEQILKHYTLEAPTLEGVQYLKKHMADVRKNKLKPSQLGWGYGLGAHTMATSLEITVKEAEDILAGLNKQFPGRDWLDRRLRREWAKNNGYIINGRGMPICVDYSKKKDLVNRLIQSTAHDLLIRQMYHFNVYRKEHGKHMRPYIPDYHDETIWAIQKGYEQEFTEATNYSFDRLNDELDWDGIEFKHGGINFGNTLEVRCDD